MHTSCVFLFVSDLLSVFLLLSSSSISTYWIWHMSMPLLLLLNSFFFFFFFFLLNRESNLNHNISIASSRLLTKCAPREMGSKYEWRDEGSKDSQKKKAKENFGIRYSLFWAYFYAHFCFSGFLFFFGLPDNNGES